MFRLQPQCCWAPKRGVVNRKPHKQKISGYDTFQGGGGGQFPVRGEPFDQKPRGGGGADLCRGGGGGD